MIYYDIVPNNMLFESVNGFENLMLIPLEQPFEIKVSINSLIIDNGAFEIYENKSSVSVFDFFKNTVTKLVKQAAKIHPEVIVVYPDVLFDMQKTIGFYEACKKDGINEELITQKGVKRMFVLQARTIDELDRISKYASGRPDIELFSLPILVRERIGVDRCLDTINNHIDLNKLHLLGFTLDDLFAERVKECRSIDTAYPYKMAMCDINLYKAFNNKLIIDIPRQKDFFMKILENGNLVNRNVTFFKSLLSRIPLNPGSFKIVREVKRGEIVENRKG